VNRGGSECFRSDFSVRDREGFWRTAKQGMSWFQILAVAVGLSMDALAVSIAAGMSLPAIDGRHVFRLAFHFGLFQFLMPVVGWVAGTSLAARIDGYDHWLAFALLTLVGGRMLWQVWAEREGGPLSDPTRGWLLVTLSVATSIDALAVGLSMAFLNVAVWMPSVVIGLITAFLVAIGIRFGHSIGGRFGRVAHFVGGLVLVGIGVRILILHTLAA
jgi:putative Mn2+ efflux pump MntP